MHFVMLGLAVLASGFLGFLAGYMKKKGENLATHEDIGKLVEQMSAVTKATKEIEAKISSDVWDRQKHWEMKREVLFVAAKKRSEEHTSELQSRGHLVCRLLLEKKKQ